MGQNSPEGQIWPTLSIFSTNSGGQKNLKSLYSGSKFQASVIKFRVSKDSGGNFLLVWKQWAVEY